MLISPLFEKYFSKFDEGKDMNIPRNLQMFRGIFLFAICFSLNLQTERLLRVLLHL